MEHSPSREDKSQEIPCILQYLIVHYCIHKPLPPVPVMSQISPVHVSPPYFLKTHLNVILSSTPSSSKKNYKIMT